MSNTYWNNILWFDKTKIELIWPQFMSSSLEKEQQKIPAREDHTN